MDKLLVFQANEMTIESLMKEQASRIHQPAYLYSVQIDLKGHVPANAGIPG
jgi:hypothetical protein